MAKTTSGTSSSSAGKASKQRKKQARREAKLMLEIEGAKMDLKKARKKQAQAQVRLEKRSATLQTLEVKLEELRAPTPETASVAPPRNAQLESHQEPSELGSSMGHSEGQPSTSPDQIVASPHVGEDGSMPSSSSSTSSDAAPTLTLVEETTGSEVMVATNEVTEMSEAADAQSDEIATPSEPAPKSTTPRKAPAKKTVATQKSAVTKRPTRPSTATKQPVRRTQSTRQPHSEAK
jgi:hypothetical protein